MTDTNLTNNFNNNMALQEYLDEFGALEKEFVDAFGGPEPPTHDPVEFVGNMESYKRCLDCIDNCKFLDSN
jgi:hypothetical protein